MNSFTKTLVTVSFCISVGSCTTSTTITFDGCTNTNNNSDNSYFTFTAGGGDEYCISSCVPKENNIGGTVTLVIPALVNGNPVSVLQQAFCWDTYNTDLYSALNVELEFQSAIDANTGDTKYVLFPASCVNMFRECRNSERYDSTNKITKTKIDLSGADISNATSLVALDVSNFDTFSVTDMKAMFYKCSGLTSLDVTNFNTSNVTDMSFMFYDCAGLIALDVSDFDTSSITDMNQMFANCLTLETLDLSNFNTSNITDMTGMFYQCQSLTNLDLSSFNTSNVTNMKSMFRGCQSLKALDVSNFNTSSVTNAAGMFYSCSGLKLLKVSQSLIVPGANTSMFKNAKSDMKVVGNGTLRFAETSGNVKTTISSGADKVYALVGDPGVSASLQTTLTNQLPEATLVEELDPTILFNATSNDVLYVGLGTSDKIILVDGSSGTISGSLINTLLDGVGYYPSALQLTGAITLSGNNSEFNQKSLIVGDGTKSTTVTFTNPQALANTDIIVNQKGKLVFRGNNKYTISHKITFKSGGLLASANRIILTDGAILKFGK